jgi:trehalose 2-sulfotransferase
MKFQYPVSEHERTAEQIFESGMEVSPTDFRIECVLMAFVNRSGSNYLADLLLSTGAFAGLEEPLNSPTIRYLAPRYGTATLADYLKRVHREQTGQTGKRWGLKVGWVQLAMLIRTKALANLLSPKIIVIRRRDLVAQAVSFYIAEKTQRWIAKTDNHAEGPPIEEIPYDGQQILEHLQGIMWSNFMIEKTLFLAQLPSEVIQYETLIDRPQEIISKLVGRILGHNLEPELNAVRTTIQRDGLSGQLKAQFLNEFRQLEFDCAR